MEGVIVPVTERSNTLTENIDKATPTEIVSLLKKCDEEIFNYGEENEGVCNKEFTDLLGKISLEAAERVSPNVDHGAIILSGCGTSGRIAFLICRAFNELAGKVKQRQCYRYICAGGDRVLTRSVESCEDNWIAGKEALVREADGLENILFIGITCGLSAAFVGGQLEYCLQYPDRFTPYLLGFNPANQARTSPNKGTSKVLLDIVREMKEKGCLLNPVVGPEAIAGSTRMKGGTATKMILESIFIAAHQLPPRKSSSLMCKKVINVYEMTLNFTYRKQSDIAMLIELAGASLVKGGTLTYLGWDSLGIMGIIDAAECVPTFGASHEDVRCFIYGGYKTLRNKQGDLSSQGNTSKIGFDYFKEERCYTLSEKDTVIFILRSIAPHEKEVLKEIIKLVKAQRCKVAFISITTDKDEYDQFLEVFKTLGNPKSVHISLPSSKLKEHCPGSHEHQKFLQQCAAEVSLKWVLNAVSTGAHVMKGKVLKNCMIDLKLTNKKLFERAMSIVSLYAKVNRNLAKHCLLKSIYRTETLSLDVLQANITQHVQQASLVNRVVPLALLMSKDSFTLASALKALEDCPIVRQYIEEHI